MKLCARAHLCFFVAATSLLLCCRSAPPGRPERENELDTNQLAKLEYMVKEADVIVEGEFIGIINDRRAEAPIQKMKLLKGTLAPGTLVVACYQATALTVSPYRGSRWMFFLVKPFDLGPGVEYRKIVGGNYDDDGIAPASPAYRAAVKRLMAAEAAAKKSPDMKKP
jgi:hypothetical protein